MTAPYDAAMDTEQPAELASAPLVARPLRIAPFHALRLTPGRVGAPASARALGRPYRDIADRFHRWEETGQVLREPGPALYLHEYTAAGLTVRGLVGAVEVARTTTDPAEAAILPHEGIHPEQVRDLAERMAEMQMNPAPILLLHRGTTTLRDLLAAVLTTTPAHQFTDRSGQYHRLWRLDAPEELGLIADELAGSCAVIADGHHRYAAYLRLHARDAGDAALDGGLAMLVDQADTPLFLGAIHRVLGGVRLDDLEQLPSTVRVTRTGPAEAVAALAEHVLVATDGRSWATLKLATPPGRLAVEVLQDELVPALPRAPGSITYAHSVDEALQGVARRRGVAVLMPAPEYDDVMRAAAAGRLLPEKATSFQPKPSVGVLIRSLRAG